MKKLIFILIVAPLFTIAQDKERLSRAYLGAMLHDFNEPGISLVNNFGINKYLGIGAGVDLTKFEGETLVPAYVDVRVNYPVNNFAPLLIAQGGYPLYNGNTNLVNEIGISREVKVRGKYFIGGGVGVSYKKGKVGVYATYIQRSYKFKYDKFEVNGRDITPDDPQSAGVLTIGLVF